jgi:hypothetical protein
MMIGLFFNCLLVEIGAKPFFGFFFLRRNFLGFGSCGSSSKIRALTIFPKSSIQKFEF